MPITITVEDGSNVADANSWGDLDGAKAYALNRGLTLTDDEVIKAQLIKAMDYLGQYHLRWLGVRQYADQTTDFPRSEMVPHGYTDYYPENTVPPEVVAAQYQLVMAQQTGMVLMPNVEPGLPVIMEKVDVLETRYATPVDAGFPDAQPSFPIVDTLLAPFLDAAVGRLRTLRI